LEISRITTNFAAQKQNSDNSIRKGLNMNVNSLHNEHLSSPHPGTILRGELAEAGMSQKELAVSIGKTTPVLNGILNGSRDINTEIAILLEAALPDRLTAEEWVKLQSEYDLEKKRREVAERTSLIKAWNILKGIISRNSLKKKINFGDDIAANLQLVYDAFGVSSIQDVEKMALRYQGFFKKSEKLQTDPINLLTWMFIVRNKSNTKHLTSSFSSTTLPSLRKKLNSILYENKNTAIRVEKVCEEYGIKYIYEPKLDKVPVDGYSFWQGENPTIVMTGRLNKIDNFAFTLMHELAHIEYHLTPNSKDEFLDVDSAIHKVTNRESEANHCATLSLWDGVDPVEFFDGISNPFGAAPILKKIAEARHMNLGVVTGQFQHFCASHNLLKKSYAVCHELIEKIN
jgi:HTH-type transcriptional regulator/antitoxin HigA